MTLMLKWEHYIHVHVHDVCKFHSVTEIFLSNGFKIEVSDGFFSASILVMSMKSYQNFRVLFTLWYTSVANLHEEASA